MTKRYRLAYLIHGEACGSFGVGIYTEQEVAELNARLHRVGLTWAPAL